MEKRKNYIPFVLVTFIAVLYHIRIQPMAGDDIFFSQATEGKGLFPYLIERYETWTSRFVIELVLVLLVKAPILWKLLDILAFATLPVLLSKLFGGGRLMNWCAAAAVLMYPFHDMGSAGWITTTVNYFFPIWGMFFVGLLIRKMIMQEKISIGEAVLAVPVCLIASSHEQVAVILFAVFLLYGFYEWSRKRGGALLKWWSVAALPEHGEAGKRNRIVLAELLICNIATLVSIALCPGNAGRNAVSIADLPVYETFHFGDKLYLGLLSVERVFIANADALFVLVAALLAGLVYLKTEDYKKTLVSGLPLMIIFGQTVLRTAYPGLSGLFVMPGQITEWSWGELSTWLPMGYLLVTVASMLYGFYCLFGEKTGEFLAVLVLLGCGFGAGAVLGFMATIYVSGERVYITLYFILLFVMLLALYRQRETVCRKLEKTSGKLAVTWVILMCLVNVGFVFLSC